MPAALIAILCALCAGPSHAGAAAAPACTKAAARKAVVDTGFARKAKARLGSSVVRRGESVLGLFDVGRRLCADVTGDGTREMVVLLQCWTVAAPSPWAIFKATSRGRWTLRGRR